MGSLASGGIIGRRLRAVFVALVILGNLIYAIPFPKMSAEDLDDPEFRSADIDLWFSIVGPVTGLDRDGFGLLARRVVWGTRQSIGALRFPFDPVFSAAHVNQQWGLFAVVTEEPDSVVVEVRRNGEWETLYRRLDPEHAWHDDQLKYRRIRGVWDGVKDEPKGTYKRMTDWIARTVFAEQPEVDRVRVVLERRRLSLPWEPVDPDVERRAERYHRREKTP